MQHVLVQSAGRVMDRLLCCATVYTVLPRPTSLAYAAATVAVCKTAVPDSSAFECPFPQLLHPVPQAQLSAEQGEPRQQVTLKNTQYIGWPITNRRLPNAQIMTDCPCRASARTVQSVHVLHPTVDTDGAPGHVTHLVYTGQRQSLPAMAVCHACCVWLTVLGPTPAELARGLPGREQAECIAPSMA